jgi:hypothetical protein
VTEDTWNFDEISFQMGVIMTAKVITGTDMLAGLEQYSQEIENASQSLNASMRWGWQFYYRLFMKQ